MLHTNFMSSLGIQSLHSLTMEFRCPKGVGGLERIVDDLYAKLMKEGVKASIYVVCGRNEKLKENLATKDWGKVLAGEHKPKRRGLLSRIRRQRQTTLPDTEDDVASAEGDVEVVGLGYVTQMAEFMVASDVLVSKAGPGKILRDSKRHLTHTHSFVCF